MTPQQRNRRESEFAKMKKLRLEERRLKLPDDYVLSFLVYGNLTKDDIPSRLVDVQRKLLTLKRKAGLWQQQQ